MYTEGLHIGDNSYVLSDESGNIILLNSNGTPEETERYLKLQNDYEEKIDELREIQSTIQDINNKEKESKKANIEMLITTLLVEGVFFLAGAATLPLLEMIIAMSLPVLTTLVIIGTIKPLIYKTKKRREKRKQEENAKLKKVQEELKQIDKEKRILKKKIEYKNHFPEEEIIPVTTVEKTKANVKMRILRLDKNTIYENIN